MKFRKKVKKTIDEKQDEVIKQLKDDQTKNDEKQDEVIKQLKENQVELSNSIDALSEIMSQQGSVSGVKSWLKDLPSDFDPLDIIREDEGEKGEEPKSLLNPGETEIIKKYGFDPTLRIIPSQSEVRKKISGTSGKKNSKNPIIKNLANKDSDALSAYLKLVKARQSGKTQTASGIYTQPKRNAYKISQRGQYGGLVIDLPKLYGHLKVVAHKNGQKVYDKQADFDTLDLLTKRFNSKKKHSELARSVFNDLNRLSEIPIHKTSKKYSKIGSGVVYYNNPRDLLSRLELLGGSISAGNNSSDVREEFANIVHLLNKLNVINNKQMNNLLKEYLI